MSQKFLTLEGPGDNAPRKKTLADIMSIALEAEDDDTLGRFRFRRAFTPPARVRRAITPPKFVKKAVRYYGAAAFTVATGGFASGKTNKIFGLSNSEQKTFNIAAKATRVAVIATATIVTAGAIAGAMAPAAGSGLSGLTGSGALAKGAGFLIKDKAMGAVWKIGTDIAGNVIGQKFSKNQMPEAYDALPDSGAAVPAGPENDLSNSNLAPSPAGAGPTASQGISEDETKSEDPNESLLGRARQAQIDNGNPMEGNDIPGVSDDNTSPDQNSDDTTPAQDEKRLAKEVGEGDDSEGTDDDTSVFSMMKKGKEATAAPESDGSISLGSLLQIRRAQMLAQKRRWMMQRRGGWRGTLRADLGRQEQVRNLLGV